MARLIKTKAKTTSVGGAVTSRSRSPSPKEISLRGLRLLCSQSLAPGEGEIILSKKRMAKQLSAQAAEMPHQPARGGSCAGEHNEARVVQSVRAGRDTMAQAVNTCDLARSLLVSRAHRLLALASRFSSSSTSKTKTKMPSCTHR